MSKYIWVAQDNQGNLIHEIDNEGNEYPLQKILDMSDLDRLDMFHIANENENYSVNLKTGFFAINDFTFYPCSTIIDITLSKKKELENLNNRKTKEMKRLNGIKLTRKVKDIDELKEEELIFYNQLKDQISEIEKGLSDLRYRLISFKRNRRDTTLTFSNGKITKSEGKQYDYDNLIGWQTTYFGMNYQRIMYVSELYDGVFEIRSKR